MMIIKIFLQLLKISVLTIPFVIAEFVIEGTKTLISIIRFKK